MQKLVIRQPRISLTCDGCKARKVRCRSKWNHSIFRSCRQLTRSPEENATGSQSCVHCIKREVPCLFSMKKTRARKAPSISLDTSSIHLDTPNTLDHTSTPLSSHSSDAYISPFQVPRLQHQQQSAYVDYLLLDRRDNSGKGRNESSMLKAQENYIGSSGLAFFSEKKISSISDRLGHTKFREHIGNLAKVINSQMNRTTNIFSSVIKAHGSSIPPEGVTVESADAYIQAYFNYVHPMYPFLDREDFEKKITSTGQLKHQLENSHFPVLYHTVLALGCQFKEGGTFDLGNGTAWRLFQNCLTQLTEILVHKNTLINVQTVTAMAIFAYNSTFPQLGNMLIAEAAKMAQMAGFNKATCPGENERACHRTFWVIYILEKTTSFACGKPSIIADFEIGTPIPATPEAVFQDFDWLLTMAQFSRLLSRTYELVFSISATLNSSDVRHQIIVTINGDLERWRNSIPEKFRPGEPFKPAHFADHLSVAVALRTHYYYYSIVTALCRASLHNEGGSASYPKSKSTEILLNAAHSIIELTRYIDMEICTPLWALGSVPLSALFILFDFVVHNPAHPDTKSNLSLLGVAAGYFCRLEYTSGGLLPSSLLSDFSNIARQYVEEFKTRPTIDKAGISGISCTTGLPSVDISSMENLPVPIPIDPFENKTNAEFSNLEDLSYITYPTTVDMTDGIDIMNFFDSLVMDFDLH